MKLLLAIATLAGSLSMLISDWAGQAFPLGRELSTAELTRRLAEEAQSQLKRFGRS